MQNKMNFYQADFQVAYKNNSILNLKKTIGPLYSMFILLRGSCDIVYKNTIHRLKAGEVHIAHRKEEFYYNFNNKKVEYLEIRFSSSILKKYDENYDLLKPFFDYQNLKTLTTKGDTYEFESGIKSLLKALDTKSSRAFVLTPFLQLICELNYLYEESKPNKIKETDSTYAKIITYIDNHLFENLSLEQVSKNVFLSKKCICNNIKKTSGYTFLEFINIRKFKEAQKIIQKTNLPLKIIAEQCGFDTYSTFYRWYKKLFGISPIDDLKYFKEHKEFYRKP